MAWSAPAAYTSSQVLTGAAMNLVRDDLRSLRNGNDHYCRVYISTNPSIANNVAGGTAITWDTIDFQVGTLWSAGNPSRFVAPVTGKYLILATLEWRSNTSNLRNIIFKTRNAAAVLQRQYDGQSQGSSGGRSNVCGKLIVQMTATDTVEVCAYQSSGGALTLHGGGRPDRTRAAVLFLGT